MIWYRRIVKERFFEDGKNCFVVTIPVGRGQLKISIFY